MYKWWCVTGENFDMYPNQKVLLKYYTIKDKSTIKDKLTVKIPRINVFTMRYINKNGDRKVKVIFEQGCFYTFDSNKNEYYLVLANDCKFNEFVNKKCDQNPNPHGYNYELHFVTFILFGYMDTFISNNL